MKTHTRNLLAALTATAALAVGSADAAIIDATTNNGSFEDGTGSGSGSTIDRWQPPIVSSGTTGESRINNNASHGTYSAVIGNNGSSFDTSGVLLNTGYTVGAGDTFDFSFDWIPLFNWDADDSITYRLFTTDDNLSSGTPTAILTGSVSGHANGEGYQLDADFTGAGAVVAANVGKELWVEFKSDTSDNEFARVDNVVLSAIPVPEPTSLALFGLGGLCMMKRRRRA